jgi:cellulose synthase/poly-beta-1,6-N-acetylglucosamine synthase-like glycosyltransferase
MSRRGQTHRQHPTQVQKAFEHQVIFPKRAHLFQVGIKDSVDKAPGTKAHRHVDPPAAEFSPGEFFHGRKGGHYGRIVAFGLLDLVFRMDADYRVDPNMLYQLPASFLLFFFN